MQLMGVLAAAPALKGQTPAPTPPAQRVSKEQVVAALATLGLVFTDPQIDMLMPTANRLFTHYETLRAIDIPLDTPPAISFSPVIPGYPAPHGASVYRPGKHLLS